MAHADKPKIGAGHAGAMWRQGWAELRAAMYSGSNVAQPAQHGMYGTLTQGEIADAKLATNEREEPAGEKSILGERLEQAENEQSQREDKEPPRDAPEPDRE